MPTTGRSDGGRARGGLHHERRTDSFLSGFSALGYDDRQQAHDHREPLHRPDRDLVTARHDAVVRRWLIPVLGYAVATTALTWPILRHIGSAIPHDAGDPILNTWILWWSTRRLPFSAAWWTAPMYYPMSDSMALSELLVALLPITVPAQLLTGNPVLAYNVAFVLSFVLCGITAYALALELTGAPFVSFAAGLAFMFAPYRMLQLSHIQVLSYYWAPLALLALHRYIRTRRITWATAFAAAWLLQSLANGYALFHFSILVALWLVWFGRPLRTAMPLLVAWTSAAVLLTPALYEYWHVHRALHLTRSINEVRAFSVDFAQFMSAPPDLLLWGGRLIPPLPEIAAFPGATVVVVLIAAGWATWWFRSHTRERYWTSTTTVIATVGAVAAAVAASSAILGPWSLGKLLKVSNAYKPLSITAVAAVVLTSRTTMARRAWAERSVFGFYIVATIVLYTFALGPAPSLLGHQVLYEAPYAWVIRLPGFATLRVPARFVMTAVLCQSMVLALVCARWALLARPAVLTVMCLGVLADGWARIPAVSLPDRGPDRWPVADAVIELPPGDAVVDFGAIYRSMYHGLPIVNGVSGYAPPHYLPLAETIEEHNFNGILAVARTGRLVVAVERATEGAEALVRGVAQLPGATVAAADARWSVLTVPRTSVPHEQPVGRSLAIRSITASRHPEDVGRMQDGTVGSAWGSGSDQRGDEVVTVDLGTEQEVGAVVLDMGAFAFGFPRMLLVDTSLDARVWRTAWSGPTGLATVRAALAEPTTVPVTIDFPSVRTRYVRLRQTGHQVGIPWWIADIGVHAPQEPPRPDSATRGRQ